MVDNVSVRGRVRSDVVVLFTCRQFMNIVVFNQLRGLTWWKTPLISSTIGSVIDRRFFSGSLFLRPRIIS